MHFCTCPRKVLTLACTPHEPGGPETLKAESHFLKTIYKKKDVHKVAKTSIVN